MICEPASFKSRGNTPFTVACVPTGIYTGVSISPCGVCKIPARAPVSGSVFISSNEKNSLFKALSPVRYFRPLLYHNFFRKARVFALFLPALCNRNRLFCIKNSFILYIHIFIHLCKNKWKNIQKICKKWGKFSWLMQKKCIKYSLQSLRRKFGTVDCKEIF